MNRTLNSLAAAAALVLATAAAPLAAQTFGNVDFSRYVAIGDSLTAGYTSGGLSQTVQATSYPALLFGATHGGSTTGFEQPLVSEPGIPNQLQLVSLAPLTLAPKPGNGQPLNLNLNRPYDNLAVPGAKVHDIVATTTGGLHPLILRGIGSQLQQAVALQPTFVTVWAGNNDVLGAALSGLAIEGVTLTPVASFEADYRTIAGALATTGADLAFATIPNVTAIPFVTTIPPFIINPTTQQPVIGPNGQPLTFLGPGGVLSPADSVLLTAQALLSQGVGIPQALGGTGLPLPDQVVLSAGEKTTINARVQAYNDVIRAVASERGAALVDINAFFNDVAANGYHVAGVEFTAEFLTGGIFSYDGVHPNAMGYAVLANQFIAAINAQLDADIPGVDLLSFMFGGAPTFTLSELLDMKISPAGLRHLRDSMGIPPPRVLLKLRPRRVIGTR